MLEVLNRTQFEAAILPGLDKTGVEHAVVVVKGTFSIAPGRQPVVAEKQVGIERADVYHGEPGLSSIKYASDAVLRKPGTDVYVAGSAFSQRGAVPHVDVGIIVGDAVRKIVRVFGDRKWERRLGIWSATPPLPFEAMPLTWERAYGGRETEPKDPDRPRSDARNPVGAGFTMRVKAVEGSPLPNLENPRSFITSPRDHPAPAGVGAVAAHWEPRVQWAGTMDERWRKERCPLLPLDFDDRFMQVAPQDQIVPRPLSGGELVQLVGLSRKGPMQFPLPRRTLAVGVEIRGRTERHAPVLDTVLVDSDLERLVLTWRASIPCGRNFLRVRYAKVEEVAA